MPIDINHFRPEKGGDISKLKLLQQHRNKPEQAIDDIVAVDEQWRKAEFQFNQLKKEKNAVSKQVSTKKSEAAKLRKAGDTAGADAAEQQATQHVEQSKQLDNELKLADDEKERLNTELQRKLASIGNLIHSSVPIAKSEDDNKVERTHALDQRRHNTDKKLFHHHELLAMIDGYSPERGVNVAGHRGYFLKGVGVLLNQALITYGLQFLLKKQYTALQPPFFMKRDIMAETAQLEEFDEALYKIQGETPSEEFYLIATSEQPISAYHRHEWLTPDELPKRYAGVSTCFRKEAGAHGKDAWGIFRIHQFEKIEQFAITSPDKSWEMHDQLIATCEEFYQSLGLQYQVINIVSGALNNAAAKKLDLEAWFPTLGVFRELVSASNCTDYQSRAMETRYSVGGGKKSTATQQKEYVHMLNATLCATERTICCLLENYQTETGVVVPEVLRPFMGMDFLPFVNPAPGQTQPVKQPTPTTAPHSTHHVSADDKKEQQPTTKQAAANS